MEFSIINHPFWGTSIYGNPHLYHFISINIGTRRVWCHAMWFQAICSRLDQLVWSWRCCFAASDFPMLLQHKYYQPSSGWKPSKVLCQASKAPGESVAIHPSCHQTRIHRVWLRTRTDGFPDGPVVLPVVIVSTDEFATQKNVPARHFSDLTDLVICWER